MSTTKLLSTALLISLTASTWVAAQDTRPARPNILWLIADDLGTEMGCYGTPQVWTPHLDQLAAEGTRYTKAFTTSPVCSPSRSAFMTGMYQTTIGAHNHRSHRDDGYQLPADVKLLTDRMRAAGYFTANIRQLPKWMGFPASGKTDWNFAYKGKPFDSDKWDDLKSHQPFYAQVNFKEPHRKFTAPPKADPAKVVFPPYYPDHPITRNDWAAYLDSVSELDRKAGMILKQLETEGLADHTVVIFFSDNGHPHIRGKQFCYDSGLHIPLMIRWPKKYPAPARYQSGGIDEQLIDAIDLTATTLGIAGIAKPANMEGRVFLGDHAEPPREYAFGARDRCGETLLRFRTVRDSRYRYIRNYMPERPLLLLNDYKRQHYPVWSLLHELDAEGKLNETQRFLTAPSMPPEELYDLQSDPHEINNLAQSPAHQQRLATLRAALDKWIHDTNDQGRELEPAEVAARRGATKADSDPNTGKPAR